MKYFDIFPKKSLIGMVHLAGATRSERISRALDELAIYSEEGMHGAILENYHGSIYDLILTIDAMKKSDYTLKIGVNVLPNEFTAAYYAARDYGLDFIQFDHVAGSYYNTSPDRHEYMKLRAEYPDIVVLGGVWPKYYMPIAGSELAADIQEGMGAADALVVTGTATGLETPLDKIKIFRDIAADFPVIVGAGVCDTNIISQLQVADGAIIGSYFKHGNTYDKVKRENVKNLVEMAKKHFG